MKKKLLLSLVLLNALILPKRALASTLTTIVGNVGGAVLGVATTLVVIFWIITGILFLFAQGAPDKLSTAKRALYTSIAGTAIVLLAQVASTIIGNALLSGT